MSRGDDHCLRCGAPWAGDQCSSPDCYCTLCPYCGEQWEDISEPCSHLVVLLFECENQLEWIAPLPRLTRDLGDAEVIQVFGDDAHLAVGIWPDGFDRDPGPAGMAQMVMLKSYPGAKSVGGDFDAGWLGDGDWVVVYVPDGTAWVAHRDATFARLRAAAGGVGDV